MKNSIAYRSRRLVVAILAMAPTALLGALVVPASSAVAADTTETLTAQTAYKCLLTAKGISAVTPDGATVRLQLNVPTSVKPGDKVSMSGTLTFQFSEQLRQNASALGATTVDAYSTDMSVGTKVGGATETLKADRWQTSPTQIGNPLEVSGALTLPKVTVPADAKGDLVLQMPQNNVAKNPNASTPATVAFVATARVSGPGGVFIVTTACFLPNSNVPVIGRIPITQPEATAAASATGSSTPSAAASGASTLPTPDATEATTADTVAAAAPDGGTVPQQTPAAGPVAVVTVTAAPTVAAQIAPVSDTRSGVYVSTTALILVGFAICLGALGYAAWANQRLRSIRNALDD